MKFFNVFKSAVLAIGLATGAAHAATVDFEVGAGSEATATRTSCVIVCTANISADASGAIGTSFSLAEGETSDWFNFFRVDVTSRYNLGGGGYDVEATLAFSDPGGAVNGSGDGRFYTAFGVISVGTLTWDNPFQTVSLANGTEYTVELEDGFAIVAGTSANVRARVTLDVAPVPLPASALLLMAGVGGLGIMSYRRRKQVVG